MLQRGGRQRRGAFDAQRDQDPDVKLVPILLLRCCVANGIEDPPFDRHAQRNIGKRPMRGRAALRAKDPRRKPRLTPRALRPTGHAVLQGRSDAKLWWLPVRTVADWRPCHRPELVIGFAPWGTPFFWPDFCGIVLLPMWAKPKRARILLCRFCLPSKSGENTYLSLA